MIAERFYFHRKRQSPEESVPDFIAELRRLAIHCNYGTHLDDALRDQFVSGLRSEAMHKRLLGEETLTLKKAVEVAAGMEAAKSAQDFKATETTVAQVVPEVPCTHCGRRNHNSNACRFESAVCHNCGKPGHIAPICQSKRRGRPGTGPAPAHGNRSFVTTRSPQPHP